MLQVKQYRKDIADLLRQGKKDYARIRVEAVIRENLMLQALEVLELYLELIAVRSQLISQTKEIPRDMIEAISSVIYSAQRVSGACLGLSVLTTTVEAHCLGAGGTRCCAQVRQMDSLRFIDPGAKPRPCAPTFTSASNHSPYMLR